MTNLQNQSELNKLNATQWELEYLKHFFSDEFLHNHVAWIQYYVRNLYDLMYQNKDKFNNGDWFGEFTNALAILLRRMDIDTFMANSGRMYKRQKEIVDDLQWVEIRNDHMTMVRNDGNN